MNPGGKKNRTLRKDPVLDGALRIRDQMELTGEWPETKNRRCKLVENEKEKSDFFFSF